VDAELDPREEGLDVVAEIAVVLSWIPAVLPNLRYYTFGAELCQAPNLRHVFILFFSFLLSSHRRQPSDTNSAGREFSLLYFSFVCEDKEAEHRNETQFMRLSSWLKVFGVYGYGRNDG
jgi:hypothetical protein